MVEEKLPSAPVVARSTSSRPAPKSEPEVATPPPTAVYNSGTPAPSVTQRFIAAVVPTGTVSPAGNKSLNLTSKAPLAELPVFSIVKA